MPIGWMSPEWEEIPRMEGFFFEINGFIADAIRRIGIGTYDSAINSMKRFKALVKPSGIFDEMTPDDKPMYLNQEIFLENSIFSRCDEIIKGLDQAKVSGSLDLKNILVHISELIYITNKYYMYAKTKVCFLGTYKPAFDIFEKEGI